jgi:hypothetical protein
MATFTLDDLERIAHRVRAAQASLLQFERRRLFRSSLRSIRIARRAPILRARLWGPQR